MEAISDISKNEDWEDKIRRMTKRFGSEMPLNNGCIKSVTDQLENDD